MNSRRLVLFDIDGTLLLGGTFWREAFEGGFRSVYPDRQIKRTNFNGKTDGSIAVELIHASGGPKANLEQEVKSVLDAYLQRARVGFASRIHELQILPGVRDLLARLALHPQIHLGLLTGNLREGAELKIGAAGLGHHLSWGVFADDHWDRYELPAIAAARAKSELGHEFRGKEIVIIGDTIHDVQCGKSIGVKSIAVGTGRGVDRNELMAAEPDHFFEDLTRIEQVMEAILA